MRRGKMDSLNLFVKLARVVLREINVYEASVFLQDQHLAVHGNGAAFLQQIIVAFT